MDVQAMRKEMENIQQNAKANLDSITCISTYYKAFLSNGEDAHNKMSGEVKRMISNNLESTSKIAGSLNQIYQQFEAHLSQCQGIFGKLVSDIILPLDIFLTKISEVYTENITVLLKTWKEVNQAKLVLDNCHLTYIQQTYQSKRSDPSSLTLSIGGSDFDKEKLLKLKSMAMNSEKIYRYELYRYNKTITNCNGNYIKSIRVLKENEETRIIFLQTTVIQFAQLLKEYMELTEAFRVNFSQHFPTEIWDKEINSTINALSTYCKVNNQSRLRLSNEVFIPYSGFLSKGIDVKVFEDIHELQASVQAQSPVLTEEEQKSIINQVLNRLLEENEIKSELIAQLMEVMRGNADIQKRFLDSILEKKKIFNVKFSNLRNLMHLSTIICHITLSQDDIFSGRFELNFSIVFIAERVFYQNPIDGAKVYLSALLSQNKIYRTKFFWRNFIELKLANKLNDHIQRVKMMQFKEEDKPSFLSKIGNALGLNFDEKKGFSLIETSRLYCLLPQYAKLDSDRKEIVDRIVPVEISSLIKECTPNIANFNCDNALEMIAELAEYYQIPKQHIAFLETYYNVSTFTIRRKLPNESKKANGQSVKAEGDELKVVLVKFAFTYLGNKDLIGLLCVNRAMHQVHSKRVYKQILQQRDLDVKCRLKVWHILLKTRELKQKFDYKKLLASIETTEDKKVKNDIDKDVHRTYSFNNDTEGKTKLSNILRIIAQCNGPIRYCQGMNSIAQFLLEMSQNEAEAFYLFLGFFTYTEYPLIFAKDLHKLKAFFYVFNRLISLYEPEIYSYLLSNSLDVHAFTPAWFITLFVNARPHIKEQGLPKVILRILDGFLLSGWKSIIKVSINLLHLYEIKLMELKAEALLVFVMSDMIRSDFFKSENIERFEQFERRTPIKRKIIANIESEFIQDEKMKELEQH